MYGRWPIPNLGCPNRRGTLRTQAQQTAPPPARPQRVDANGVLVEQFVVPVEYRIEEPEEVAGWNPTKKRQVAALTPAVPPGGLTPEQREQWANQSR